MQKDSKSTKRSLQKALQERLARLTASLHEAEVGDKGIELIKEMKELCAMLETAASSSRSGANSGQEPQEVRIVWGAPHEEKLAKNNEESVK